MATTVTYCVVLGVLVCMTLLAQVQAEKFNCYSCQYTDTGTMVGYECVDDPAKMINNRVACELPSLCHTKRMDYVEKEGVRSFFRGCIPKGTLEQGCSTYDGFKTCFTFCATEMCNNDEGDNPTTPGGGGGSGEANLSPSLSLLLLLSILAAALTL